MPERRRRPAWLTRLERLCGRLGILLVLLAILLGGPKDEAALLALSGAAVATALALWAGRAAAGRSLSVGWPALALVGFAGYLGLQLVPMPPSVLSWLSPAAWELYRSAHEPLGLYPRWRPLSLDPPATLSEAARLLGLAALFVVLDHRARASDRARIERLLVPAGALAVLALLALGLHSTGQRSLFGLWSIDGALTPFVSPLRNDNHFAGALGVASLVWLGFAARPSGAIWGRALALGAALVCVATVLRGTSIGGALALGAGMVVFALLTRSRRAAAWPLAAAAVATLVVFMFVHPEQGFGWPRTLAPGEGKRAPMDIALAIGEHYPVFGAGGGAFRTLHDRHRLKHADVTFTHVENAPLQAIAELGWPIGLAGSVLMVLALVALVRRGRASPLEAGAAAAAVGLVLHNLVDYSLHYVGGYLLVALLAGATRREVEAPPVVAWSLGAASLAVVGIAFVVSLPALPMEESRLEALVSSEATDAQVEETARALLTRRPASYVAAQAVVQRAVAAEAPIGKRAVWLGTLLELAPQNGYAHLLAGEALAKAGAKGQALLEWRLAASLGVPSVAHVLHRYPQLEAVLEAAPSEPRPLVEMARILMEEGRVEWALALLEAKRTGPQHELDGLLTELLERVGRWDDALTLARSLRRNGMDVPSAWRAEALALMRVGKSEEALLLLDEGFKRMHGDLMLGTLLAGQQLRLGRAEQALETLSLIDTKGRPQPRSQVAAMRSQVFEAMGKPGPAIGEMWTVVTLDPTNVRAMLRLSRLCLAEGRHEEAARALAHAPPQPEVLHLRALIEERSRRRRPSAAELESLLK